MYHLDGFGRTVCQYISDSEYGNPVLSISLPDDYIEHGSVDILRHETGIDEETITGGLMINIYRITVKSKK